MKQQYIVTISVSPHPFPLLLSFPLPSPFLPSFLKHLSNAYYYYMPGTVLSTRKSKINTMCSLPSSCAQHHVGRDRQGTNNCPVIEVLG